MGAGKLDEVKEEGDGHTILLQVDREGYIQMVVGGCPGIGGEAQLPCVFLYAR